MARRKKYEVKDPFIREDSMITAAGKTVAHGDIIKIHGEWGTKFKFLNLVTNPSNGAIWVDCFELERGITARFRAFRPDRVKALPKKRGKRAKRTGDGSTR